MFNRFRRKFGKKCSAASLSESGSQQQNLEGIGAKRKRGSLKSIGVRLWFSMQMAFHGIISNPLRSALTLLGVAIGVASVISLMSIGEGARRSVMEQFSSLGTNVIIIEAKDSQYAFPPERADEFQERVEFITAATPVVEGKADIRWRRTRAGVEILGVNEQFPLVRDHALVSGQFFNEIHVEQRSPVVVLGYNLAVTLMKGRDPVGQSMIIDGLDYRILGVLSEKGEANGEGIDNKIIMPYSAAQKITAKKQVNQIWCKAESQETVDLAIVQLGRIFRQEMDSGSAPIAGGSSGGEGMEGMEGMEGGVPDMGVEAPLPDGGMDMPIEEEEGSSGGSDMLFEDEPITVTSLNKMVEEADRANRVMTLLLGAIAAVSLLVGGLGIMNIMLVAVTERIGEIGVRRALGARQGDLIGQFILEALYLSGFGALLGIIIGLSLLSVFNSYGLTAVISFVAIRVAVLVALGCGLVFGVYPAFSASSVPPVEALRRN